MIFTRGEGEVSQYLIISDMGGILTTSDIIFGWHHMRTAPYCCCKRQPTISEFVIYLLKFWQALSNHRLLVKHWVISLLQQERNCQCTFNLPNKHSIRKICLCLINDNGLIKFSKIHPFWLLILIYKFMFLKSLWPL